MAEEEEMGLGRECGAEKRCSLGRRWG